MMPIQILSVAKDLLTNFAFYLHIMIKTNMILKLQFSQKFLVTCITFEFLSKENLIVFLELP